MSINPNLFKEVDLCGNSMQIQLRSAEFINMRSNQTGVHVFWCQRRWTKYNAGIRKRGRERGLFWVHRQEHGYKGACKSHVILRGTIFRTVGARVEIDVWASLSYSHLHWWLHTRPLSHGWNRALFTINDKPTRISQPMTTVSYWRGHCFFALFVVRSLQLFPRDEQRHAKFGQADLVRALADSHASVFPFYILLRYLSRIQSSSYR